MSKIIKDLNNLDLNGSYTYADYLKWRFPERVELFKGKVYKIDPVTYTIHQQVSGALAFKMLTHFKKGTCSIYFAPFDVRIAKSKTKHDKVNTVVQPDLCLIIDKEKLDDLGCIGVPDLMVEILKPDGNNKKEMGIKFDLYEENGVIEYWIVNPTEKTILIYSLQNEKFIGLKTLTEDDEMKSPLFPDLIFSVGEIF
jgi:Uma2 family endonuclease